MLAASGFLSDVLPGLSIGMFAGLNAGYLLLAALAAIVFTAAHNREGNPTYFALLAAACITMWAVIGELVTLAQLLARGGLPPLWVLMAGAPIAFFLFWYARRSILQVLLAKPPSPPPPPVVVIIGPEAAVEAAAVQVAAAVQAQLPELAVPSTGPSALL